MSVFKWKFRGFGIWVLDGCHRMGEVLETEERGKNLLLGFW